MGDEREVRKIEVVNQLGDVVGEGVEIVAASGLIGAAVSSPVETYAADPSSAKVGIW